MTAADVDALLEHAAVVRVPMRLRFRGVQEREAVLLRGPAGWGEFAPFPEYPDDEAARWLAAAVEAAWVGWPAPVRDSVPVNATVPAVPAAGVPEVLQRFPGCTTAKVKVAEPAQTLADDVDRVAAVRAALGESARVRVDANGAWSVDDARTALAALDRAAGGLEYAEQPCASVEDLAALRVALARDGLDLPVAADESVRRARDWRRVAALEAADVVVVKVAPLGGVRAALAVAEETGLPAVVSSALDTSVGIAAGLALAAALPRLDHACGLATAHLLADDVAPSQPVVAGALRPGAVEPDPEALARLAATPERAAWWRARLARCAALLPALVPPTPRDHASLGDHALERRTAPPVEQS